MPNTTTAAGFALPIKDYIRLVITLNMAGWTLDETYPGEQAVFWRGWKVTSKEEMKMGFYVEAGKEFLMIDKSEHLSFVTWKADENIENFNQLMSWIGNGAR